MEVIRTAIDGVVIIEPRVFRDSRGYFFESFNLKEFEQKVRPVNFVQDNESCSSYGVLRSPTFGQHVAVELSGENHRQFFIPRGFAHGFCVLSQTALFQYKCDNFYAPQSEGAVAWNDPALDIDWKVRPDDVILSEKDTRHPLLKDVPELFDYNEDLYRI